jgi:hypothetical protein
LTNVNEKPILNSIHIKAREVHDAWTLELNANTDRCTVGQGTTFATIIAYDEDFNQQLFYFLTPSSGQSKPFSVSKVKGSSI